MINSKALETLNTAAQDKHQRCFLELLSDIMLAQLTDGPSLVPYLLAILGLQCYRGCKTSLAPECCRTCPQRTGRLCKQRSALHPMAACMAAPDQAAALTNPAWAHVQSL